LTLNQAYVDKLSARIRNWDAEIRRWVDQAETAPEPARQDMSHEISSLCEKRDTVQDLLHQLQAASGAAWHVLKTGMEAAWCDFTQAFEQATARYSA